MSTEQAFPSVCSVLGPKRLFGILRVEKHLEEVQFVLGKCSCEVLLLLLCSEFPHLPTVLKNDSKTSFCM